MLCTCCVGSISTVPSASQADHYPATLVNDQYQVQNPMHVGCDKSVPNTMNSWSQIEPGLGGNPAPPESGLGGNPAPPAHETNAFKSWGNIVSGLAGIPTPPAYGANTLDSVTEIESGLGSIPATPAHGQTNASPTEGVPRVRMPSSAGYREDIGLNDRADSGMSCNPAPPAHEQPAESIGEAIPRALPSGVGGTVNPETKIGSRLAGIPTPPAYGANTLRSSTLIESGLGGIPAPPAYTHTNSSSAEAVPRVPSSAGYRVETGLSDRVDVGLGRNPAQLAYEQPADPIGEAAPRALPSGVGGTAVDARSSDSMVALKARSRRFEWAVFMAGNFISAAAIISEISSVNSYLDERDENVGDSNWLRISIVEYDMSVVTLAFGLVVEVFSAVLLSLIYRSPLDIKSVHKVPPSELKNCGGNRSLFFLAPFSWALIYLFSGYASLQYATGSSFDGKLGSGVGFYLNFAGALMFLGGLVFLGTSVASLWLSFESTKWCGTAVGKEAARKKLVHSVLSKGLLFDIVWQVQGAVWAYHTGGLAIVAAVSVGLCNVLGEVLTAYGSLAP